MDHQKIPILGIVVTTIMLIGVAITSTGFIGAVYEKVTHWARAPGALATSLFSVMQTIVILPTTRLLTAATSVFVLAGAALMSVHQFFALHPARDKGGGQSETTHTLPQPDTHLDPTDMTDGPDQPERLRRAGATA